MQDTLVVKIAGGTTFAATWLPIAAAWLAAIAALVAGVYGPRVQWRATRSQMLSDARLAWMRELRTAVADAMRCITQLQGIRLQANPDKLAAVATLAEFTHRVALIRMMLDRAKPKHHALEAAFTDAMDALRGEPTTNAYADVMARIDNRTLDLLDEAWIRVRKGD